MTAISAAERLARTVLGLPVPPAASRVFLWKLGVQTITRRGIWERDREIVDVVETDDPQIAVEYQQSFEREAAQRNRECEVEGKAERFTVTRHTAEGRS